jgi:hypothetical protein
MGTDEAPVLEHTFGLWTFGRSVVPYAHDHPAWRRHHHLRCPSTLNAASSMSDPDAILPDRITVLTCLGCGAMGREARCEGDCSEHKLLLVDAGEFDALQSAAQLARQRNEAFKPIALALLDSHPSEQACTDAYRAMRAVAHKALEATEPYDDRGDWQAPPAQTGWWCAQCGNVDAPQPCIGVCVWRQTEWSTSRSTKPDWTGPPRTFALHPKLAAFLIVSLPSHPTPDAARTTGARCKPRPAPRSRDHNSGRLGPNQRRPPKVSKRRTTHRT